MNTQTEKVVSVFDCGPGNFVSISGIAFINGLAITDKESDKTLLRNYIEQIGSNWTEAVFDVSNPRHANASIPANMEHIIVGVQTASSLSRDDNQLAKAIADGTYVDLANTPEGQAAIDMSTLITPAAIAKATAAQAMAKK